MSSLVFLAMLYLRCNSISRVVLAGVKCNSISRVVLAGVKRSFGSELLLETLQTPVFPIKTLEMDSISLVLLDEFLDFLPYFKDCFSHSS